MSDMGFSINKRSTGAFMTTGDAFSYDCVRDFVAQYVAPLAKDGNGALSACEPYCGTGALIVGFNGHFSDIISNITWHAYDVNPPNCNDMIASIQVHRANTLLSLPEHYDLIVTNPPYLARNSARRRGLDFPFDKHGIGLAKPQDLYQFALDTCLDYASCVMAIIPESFITSPYAKDRLRCVLSLPGDMFDDTDCPVCLAMFSQQSNDGNDYEIHAYDRGLIGTWHEIVNLDNIILFKDQHMQNVDISFNVPEGIIGLHGIDGVNGSRIRFVKGSDIPSSKVKQSSRAITRINIDGITTDDAASVIIKNANETLNEWRDATSDVFLTAFKGTRNDGRYRRRLSYGIAMEILRKAVYQTRANIQ